MPVMRMGSNDIESLVLMSERMEDRKPLRKMKKKMYRKIGQGIEGIKFDPNDPMLRAAMATAAAAAMYDLAMPAMGYDQ